LTVWRSFRQLWKRTDGAVAPTVALSLVGLIAAGGLAFDYARLAAMDTELQQAADQAALAAATQLDRTEGSQDRAEAAIQDGTAANRLAANLTRFSNDEAGAGVEIVGISFCSAFDDSVADTDAACTDATGDEDSRFVIVTTALRTANYALTPIVGAFSATSEARAVAGVESSICNVAPLLVCVPDNDFPTDEDVGKGLLLKPLDGVSGNYGLLDFGNGQRAVTDALMGFGLSGCQSTDDNETEPGTKEPVTDAVNTRLDVYAQNNPDVWNQRTGAKCDGTTGHGCPAPNTTKDMVLRFVETIRNQTTQPTPTASCPADPTSLTKVPELVESSPRVEGYDRDNCFYNANHSCGTGLAGNIGDGEWDRQGYFDRFHGGDMSGAAAFAMKAPEDLTRYDVYKWELDNKAARLARKTIVSMTASEPDRQGRRDYTFTTQCTYPQPVYGTSDYQEQKDRRVLPVVAADCSKLKGKGQAYEDYVILRVFDVFLTEPSLDRTRNGVKVTDNKEIFAEVIGPAQTFEASGFQYYSRNRPYLIR
jgi:Flp pilus assembly protein TadG